MPRLLEVRVGPPRDALDRFEAAWNRAAEGQKQRPLSILLLEDLPALLRTLSPARWELLKNLRDQGPCSIYELARRLGRDYKNVHTDTKSLLSLGLVEKRSETEVAVPWDSVRAELRF